jgi:hypothetical protein
MSTKSTSGVTTANVRLRSGPGTEHAPITTLPVRTALEVLAQEGDWLQVKVNGRDGFVHRSFVQLASQGVPEGFLREKLEAKPPAATTATTPTTPAASTPKMTRDTLADDVASVPLEVLPEKRLRVNPKDPLLNRLAADIWNRYGSLIGSISSLLSIEAGVAIAVFAVESGGKCFGPDGRMIIRFENQIFFDYWGKHNQARYQQHFTFNPQQRWLDHKWRPTPDEPWRPVDAPNFHGVQSREWEVLNFARTLNDTAAKNSISMGAPQIMGFNFAAIGYESVQQMFDAFAGSERAQIVGFFDFVQGPAPNSRRILALQQQDFNTFASLYNGPGQAAKYGGLIKTTYDAFNQMKAAAGIA